MKRPLLIDLFCGEGGAAMGYHRAGWEVLGVDYKPQPRYPFAFIRANALDKDHRLLQLATAIHASPPCQFGSELTPVDKRENHLNLIPATRQALQDSGKPYVIENVRAVAPHLISPVSLFGTMFGNHCVDSQGRKFVLSRERCFETNWTLVAPEDNGPQGYPIANVFGGHFRVRSGEFRTAAKTARTVDLPGEDRSALAKALMGMPWATMQGMSEAVPPSYTHEIGRQLRALI